MLTQTTWSLLLISVIAFPALAEDPPLPTPTELLALIEASRTRFRTCDLAYRESHYLKVNEIRPDAEPDLIVDAIWRRSGDREFQSLTYTRTLRTPGVASPSTAWLAIDAERGLRFVLSSDGRQSGIVDRPGNIQMIAQTPVELALAPWSSSYLAHMPGEPSEVRPVDGGRLLLVSTILDHPLRIEWTIDPQLNYAPRECKVIGADETLFVSLEMSDFREVDAGLWFPHRIICTTNAIGVTQYEVKTLSINTSLPDDRMTLPFPSGTLVSDRIADKSYHMLITGPPRDSSSDVLYDWKTWTLALLALAAPGTILFLKSRRPRIGKVTGIQNG